MSEPVPVNSAVAAAPVPVVTKSKDEKKGDTSPDSTSLKDSYNGEKPGVHSFNSEDNIFNTELGKHFIPPANWEGSHRFDADATWTPEEEAAVIRKCDYRITVLACICFVALQLDRGNIQNALSDTFLADLKLNTNDYNAGQTIFTCSFLFAELPSQLISKKVGVDRWVPFQMVAWSIVAMSQAAIQHRWSFFLTRSLLGLLEGGFIPDIVLYLTYYFKGKELAVRLSWFWASLTMTTIVGAFLAAGLLEMRGLAGMAGWRWLFLIEGAMTLLVGIFAGFYLPPSPTQTASRFRGKKGWFTEREEIIIVNRIIRDDPTKSDMHNRQGVSLKLLWDCVRDVDMWPVYAIGLTFQMSLATVGAYFTLTLRQIGFNTFNTNLLTIPYNVMHIATQFILTYATVWTGERSITASLGNWYQLPFFIALVLIPKTTGKWPKFALLTLLLGAPSAHPVNVSWNSINSGSVGQRSVSQSLYNISVQISSICAANIYRQDDRANLYARGNKVLLGILVANLFIWAFAKVYFVKRNAYKAKKWDALTDEQKDHYLATTTDKGNKKLTFRFHH